VRLFKRNNSSPALETFAEKINYNAFAFSEEGDPDTPEIFSRNLIEFTRYGMIDDKNNSIIPNPDFLENIDDSRLLDFVADSASLMKLNFQSAVNRNFIDRQGAAFADFKVRSAYQDPLKRYGEYIKNILQFYNKTHIPKVVGKYNITSYEDYVNNFFKLFFNDMKGYALTMTRFNTSNNASILDTGLAFSYYDLEYNKDQQKINTIIDHPSFGYFRNLCLNMGFKIDRDSPNILVYDINSPANDAVKISRGLYSLEYLFSSRFTYTYLIDNLYLYDYINIYYNKYVSENFLFTIPRTVCNKTIPEVIKLDPIPKSHRMFNDRQEVSNYIQIRNHEEGAPFNSQFMEEIYKRSIFLLKRFDKSSSLGYINNMFRDQVWNKDDGFHDLIRKLGMTNEGDDPSY